MFQQDDFWGAALSRGFTQDCKWIKKCKESRREAKEGRVGCVNFATHQNQQPL